MVWLDKEVCDCCLWGIYSIFRFDIEFLCDSEPVLYELHNKMLDHPKQETVNDHSADLEDGCN